MSDKSNKKVALVTGANKGIGLEVSKKLAKLGYIVVLTGRDKAKVDSAAQILKNENLEVDSLQLEVSNIKSCRDAFEYISNKFGRLDVLINNAGVYIDGDLDISQIDEEVFEQTMAINVNGVFFLSKLFIPLMKKNHYGRIVNVSSSIGQLSEISKYNASYKISKATLNLLTRAMVDTVNTYEIKINSVCPGWVKTEMGGELAPRTVEKGAETIIWAATAEPTAPTGKFFKDKKEIAW